MLLKKWHLILSIIVFSIFTIILLPGLDVNEITNTHFISAGTFSIFPVVNTSSEKLTESGESSQENLHQQHQKLMDAVVSIKEWNTSYPQSRKRIRNITYFDLSDEDFNEYPELKRVMLDVKDEPLRNVSGQSLSVAYFPANLSDYYHWLLDSICKDKTRLECYDDFPVFEYHGRHYDIGVAFF